MGDDGDGMDYQAPEAKAYEAQSGGVLDVLKRLRSDFIQKKGDFEKEEMNAVHASNMMLQDLADTVEGAKDSIAEKTKLRQAKLEQAAVDGKSGGQQKAAQEAD